MEQEEVQEAEEQPNDPPEGEEPDGDGQEAEGEAPPQEQEQKVDPRRAEIERRAREKQWVPFEEYTGRPENWVDAEEYLKSPPKLRQERDTLKGEVASLKRTMDMLRKDTQSLREQSEREGYERAISEIRDQQRQAVAEGDTERWEALEKRRGEIKPPAPPKPEPDGEQVSPEVQAWMDERPWTQDPALNLEAAGVLNRLVKAHPHMPPIERLGKVEEIIKSRYPEDFGIQAQEPKPQYRRAQKVSGMEARPGNSANGGQKGWADIPQEDRSAAKSIIGEGQIYKSEADYAKAYWRHYG